MRIFASQLWTDIVYHMVGLKKNNVKYYEQCLSFI